MIQFNLLPDIKLQFLKAQRLKRILMVITLGATGLCVGILFLFVSVTQLQAIHISNLDKDIKKLSTDLTDTPDLNKILTIQNQLNNMTQLHEKRPVVSRLTDFLPQLTPTQIKYAKILLDVDASTIIFSGSADSLRSTNQFVDTLKFTKFKIDQEQEKSAFSEVVMTNFGRDERGASFDISLKFDKEMFNNTKNVTLNVPTTTTTRSVTEKPSSLFQPLSNPDDKKGAQ